MRLGRFEPIRFQLSLTMCERTITLSPMITVKTTPEFNAWLTGIKDKVTRIRLARRLDRVQQGNFGDVRQVGECVFEMREHFGPGWRMYYARHGQVVVVMLGGGDKSTQSADIIQAIKKAATLEE